MAPTLETHWYYLGADGKVVTGPQVIDGVRVYFNYRGHQAKRETLATMVIIMIKTLEHSSKIALSP